MAANTLLRLYKTQGGLYARPTTDSSYARRRKRGPIKTGLKLPLILPRKPVKNSYIESLTGDCETNA
jgi:hypothetical protein